MSDVARNDFSPGCPPTEVTHIISNEALQHEAGRLSFYESLEVDLGTTEEGES